MHPAKCPVRPLIPSRRPEPAPPGLQLGQGTAFRTGSSQASSGFEVAVSRGSSLSMIARVTGECAGVGVGYHDQRRVAGACQRHVPELVLVVAAAAGFGRDGAVEREPGGRGRRLRRPGVDQHRVVRLAALGGVYCPVLDLEAVLTRRRIQAATVEPRPAVGVGRRVQYIDVPAAHHEHGDGLGRLLLGFRLVLRYPVREGGQHGRRRRRRRRSEFGREGRRRPCPGDRHRRHPADRVRPEAAERPVAGFRVHRHHHP